MSVFDIHQGEFKGFYKTYWAYREDAYWNRRMTPAKPYFQRVRGKHKRIGWRGMACSLKQFDVKRARVYRRFRARTQVPWELRMINTVWGFGKGGAKQLAFNTKFYLR